MYFCSTWWWWRGRRRGRAAPSLWEISGTFVNKHFACSSVAFWRPRCRREWLQRVRLRDGRDLSISSQEYTHLAGDMLKFLQKILGTCLWSLIVAFNTFIVANPPVCKNGRGWGETGHDTTYSLGGSTECIRKPVLAAPNLTLQQVAWAPGFQAVESVRQRLRYSKNLS